MLIFGNETEKAVCTHAQTEYPKECCGILLGKRIGARRLAYEAIPTENSSDEDKATRFLIAPLELVKAEALAERKGLEIVGFYHSHPDRQAVASDTDRLSMLGGYSYPIVSVRNGVCVGIKSFEKPVRASAEARQEKIIGQGEKQNADFGIYIGNAENVCRSERKDRNRGNDRP